MKQLILSLLIASAAIALPAQRIAVLSDIHVSPGGENDKALREAVAEINNLPFDIVIVNGDLSNEGSDVELRNVKEILDGVRHPLLVLPGNHENNWSQSATKTFVDLWGRDRFAAVVDSLVLVGINCGPYMKMGDGHIKQEDLHWLKTTLDTMVTPGRRVLSFNHYPILDDLDNYDDYLAVLESYPVVAHVNGHYHVFREYPAGGADSGSDLPGVMTRALKTGTDNFGYAEIEVDPQWIHIYNKNIGQPRKPVYAYAVKDKHKTARHRDRQPVAAPEGYEVTKVWADSASIFTRLGFDADNVYFGNSLGEARAVDKADGALVWSVPTGASLFSRPVVLAKGTVAVPMHDGIIVLDSRTGKQVRKYASKEGPYVADGAITTDGKHYIQGGYKRIESRRPSDGKLIWSYDSLFNYCQAAPVVDGTDLVFGAWDTNLRCLDIRSGKLRWVWNNGKAQNMLGPGNVVPVVTDTKVFIVAPDRYMTAIDRATGRTLWRNNSHRFRESMGASQDLSRVYAKTMDGHLVAVDATAHEYKELWDIDLGIGYEHAPCVIVERDGVVYAGSRRGVLSMVASDGSGLIASLPVGVSEINGIDVDPFTGDIYVSLIEGTIYRVAKK